MFLKITAFIARYIPKFVTHIKFNKELVALLLFPLMAFLLVGCAQISSPLNNEPEQPAYLNQKLPFELRVEDLVSRMTLEEKVSQMLNEAPAIERLGIPAYNWWSEGLHGVARAGLATVFPQAIGLAATWDEDHMFRVATAISDEARAKHHAFVARDKRFIYQGLTLWSPNINIFRDPRWGRGQETYGEDPFLTGKMAAQFIRGLQGEDSKYLKTVATVKHYAVHSGPEPERHSFNAVTDKRDLFQFYLPQFELAIAEGKPYSLMCAYNRYNGEAACGSEYLLEEILRNNWQFDGFVVSDCGAILDMHKYHKVTTSPETSAALAVRAGTDLNCGNVYPSLVEAHKQGLIEESTIDKAVKRLFMARMKLGMFDDSSKVKFTSIPYSVVDSKEHKKLALNSARKSIVLLKNEKQILPLSKTLKSLAVIGPNADQWLMLLGNYNGSPSSTITPLQGLKEKLPNTKIMYAQGSELADGIPLLKTIPETVLSNAAGQPGLMAEFFNNAQLEGKPLFSKNFPVVDVNWRDNAPRKDMNDDNFSVRWQGKLKPKKSGKYEIGIISSCNTRVFLNGKEIANTSYHFRDEYGDPRTRKSDWISLKAGQSYNISVEAIETYADAQVQLVWSEPQNNLEKEALNIAEQAEAVVLFMGLTPRMEGEELKIKVDGFRGGDRTDIALPKVQQDLIKKIHALGKPTVLVLLNGSALALNWEQENIPAILEAWYPGQASGQAIADVLFGDYNPAGRLPVTFYKSVKQLPALDDYNISNQTYRYFDQEPLYPFGYGLSYSQFEYSDLKIKDEITLGKDVKVKFKVKNISKVAGEEVVQLYIKSHGRDARDPIRFLAAFDRVYLAPGKSKKVTLRIPASAFTSFNEEGERLFVKGKYTIFVGGGQPEQHLQSSNIISKWVSAEAPK